MSQNGNGVNLWIRSLCVWLRSSWLGTGLRSGWQLISGVLDIRLLGNASHSDKDHNNSNAFHFKLGQTTITLCILCVGVSVADVIPAIFFNTYFLREC